MQHDSLPRRATTVCCCDDILCTIFCQFEMRCEQLSSNKLLENYNFQPEIGAKITLTFALNAVIYGRRLGATLTTCEFLLRVAMEIRTLNLHWSQRHASCWNELCVEVYRNTPKKLRERASLWRKFLICWHNGGCGSLSRKLPWNPWNFEFY